MSETLTIPAWAQGRTGLGQGGYSSSRFEAAIGEPVSISLRAPIPLETEMTIAAVDGGWQLLDGSTVVMEAVPSPACFHTPDPISIDEAADARTRFPATPETHNAPNCRSCGFGEVTMHVWPGSVADGSGRVATDWIPPAWAGDGDGVVDPGLVWMALDCTCGFYVGHYPERRNAVTVQFAVEILEPIRVGRPYAIVGHDGRWTGGWDGRKRGAGSCVFDAEGQVVARSDSFWLSVPDQN